MAEGRIPTASPEAERLFAERGLTERECLAARSVLAGMTAEAAAPLMGISPSTVGSLRQNAYRKLGLSGASELIEKYGAPAASPSVVPAGREALRARGLSETQASVLALVAAGNSSSEIARELGIAPGTVSSARANGYRLLGIHSRGELVGLLASGEKSAPERPRGQARRRGALAIVSVAILLILLAVAAWWPGKQAGPAEAAPDELTAISHTHGIVSLDDVVAGYREGGVAEVRVTRGGDVDDERCLITEALSDGDPRLPDSLYEGATVYLTVTSDTEVPSVYDMSPIDATRELEDAGLVPDPAFTSYQGVPGKPMVNQPRVTSMSLDPGTEARVGTTVSLAYDAPLEGYGR